MTRGARGRVIEWDLLEHKRFATLTWAEMGFYALALHARADHRGRLRGDARLIRNQTCTRSNEDTATEWVAEVLRKLTAAGIVFTYGGPDGESYLQIAPDVFRKQPLGGNQRNASSYPDPPEEEYAAWCALHRIPKGDEYSHTSRQVTTSHDTSRQVETKHDVSRHVADAENSVVTRRDTSLLKERERKEKNTNEHTMTDMHASDLAAWLFRQVWDRAPSDKRTAFFEDRTRSRAANLADELRGSLSNDDIQEWCKDLEDALNSRSLRGLLQIEDLMAIVRSRRGGLQHATR